MRSAWGRAAVMAFSVTPALCNTGCGDTFVDAFRRVLLSIPTDRTCGPFELSALIPDCPLSDVCFTRACQKHDVCYATCGSIQLQCDTQFLADLSAECLLHLRIDDPRLSACLTTAIAYWSAVVGFGQFAFLETQASAGCFDADGQPFSGACCLAGDPPSCQLATEDSPCPQSAVFVPQFTCDEVDAELGGCRPPPNDDCADVRRVCEGQVADSDLGTCGVEELTAGGPRVCSVSRQDCFTGVPCLPIDDAAYRCRAVTDNRLARTDGNPVDDACAPSEESNFAADVWLSYIAPCSGTLTVRMCDGTFYDSMLEVYGTEDADGTCDCPTSAAPSLACDDDGCLGSGTGSVATVDNAVAGNCYWIRVGGWSPDGTDEKASRGVSELDIGIICD